MSDDQTRENLTVLELDAQTGTVLGKRLYGHRDLPLPPTYASPKPPFQPRSSVSVIVVGSRYKKLYLAAQLEDTAVRPAHLLSTYDLTGHGDPIADSLHTYRYRRHHRPDRDRGHGA